jgi:hypothetical protein
MTNQSLWKAFRAMRSYFTRGATLGAARGAAPAEPAGRAGGAGEDRRHA